MNATTFLEASILDQCTFTLRVDNIRFREFNYVFNLQVLKDRDTHLLEDDYAILKRLAQQTPSSLISVSGKGVIPFVQYLVEHRSVS